MNPKSLPWMCYIMCLYIALYFATGKAHEQHDEVISAIWLALFASGLMMCTRGQKG